MGFQTIRNHNIISACLHFIAQDISSWTCEFASSLGFSWINSQSHMNMQTLHIAHHIRFVSITTTLQACDYILFYLNFVFAIKNYVNIMIPCTSLHWLLMDNYFLIIMSSLCIHNSLTFGVLNFAPVCK
jgi:hypothetical protein